MLPDTKIPLRQLNEVYQLLDSIYKGEYKSEFDDKCIEKYEVILSDGIPTEVFFYYNRVKILINGKSGYWPIFSYKEDYNLEGGLKLMREIGERGEGLS